MKPIYILERYNDSAVRRQRASLEEVRAVVDGKSNDRLAFVKLDEDGDIIATPLTQQDLVAIGAELNVEHERRIRELLDAAAKMARSARGISGVSCGSFGAITVWIEDAAPGTEDIALAWADEHGAEVKRNSPPSKPRKWRPDAEIKIDGVDVCRLVWPEREAFADEAVEQEIAAVTSERVLADSELDAIAEAF